MIKKTLAVYFLTVLTNLLFAQESGKLLIIADKELPLSIDGQTRASLVPSQPRIFDLVPGEHYVQVGEVNGLDEFGEIVAIESGKQKALNLKFQQQVEPSGLRGEAEVEWIENTRTGITGSITVGLWMSENPGESYPNFPTYYYAFEEGDQIVIDLQMENRKGTNIIEVATYPEGTVKFAKEGFQHLNQGTIMSGLKTLQPATGST